MFRLLLIGLLGDRDRLRDLAWLAGLSGLGIGDGERLPVEEESASLVLTRVIMRYFEDFFSASGYHQPVATTI